MKPFLLFIFPMHLLMLLLSEKENGGPAIVARIAEIHLTAEAKQGIHGLLGNQSIVDAASWSDEILNQRKYRHTAPWHFLYLQPGLRNQGELEYVVKAQRKVNLYSAIMQQEQILKDTLDTREQRATALKFLIALVWNAHNPMHVSSIKEKDQKGRAPLEDGNLGLRSAWDSGIVDKQGPDNSELAVQIDKETLGQIKQFQIDDPMRWLWESYRISSRLYAEAGNHSGEDHNQQNTGVLNRRLELAGLRLANFLNTLFPYKGPFTYHGIDNTVENFDFKVKDNYATTAKDAESHLGRMALLTSKVCGHKTVENTVMIYLGAKYPSPQVTVILTGVSRLLAKHINGKTVMVIGKVINYDGRPAIEITDPRDVTVLKSTLK